MTADKPDKKMSYFPRSWGAGRREARRKRQAEARRAEENQPRPEKEDTAKETQNVPEPESAMGPGCVDIDEEAAERETADKRGRPCGHCPRLGAAGDDADESENGLEDDCMPSAESGLEQEALEWLDAEDSEVSPCPEVRKLETPPESEAHRVKVTVVGVRFGYAGRVYHFDAGALELPAGDWVIVKTEKGLGMGQVAVPPAEREISAAQLEGLRKVIRKAEKSDFEQKKRCVKKESEAYNYCLEMIGGLGLPMKLVSTECFFDGSKYVFYFTAEGRVDFRELVKLLVARFPVRIEMRQIGVRHEAKMTGGLACCGEELCCSRFLTDFRPVSVKMAKTQNLSLNPTKISGVCGRLMCCLAYEYDIYEDFRKGLPKVGKKVNTVKGEGIVVKHDPLSETVVVRLDEQTTIEVTKDEIVGEDPPPPPKKGKKKGG